MGPLSERTFDPAVLRGALASIPAGALSLPSTYGQTNVHHGYRRLTLVSAGFRHEYAHLFAGVLDAFAPVFDAWISVLPPGGFIRPHRDAGPWRERWQVPIVAAGRFGGEGHGIPVDGVPFAVTHFEPHWVLNDSPHDRVHIVLDRDRFLDLPSRPFELFPIPPELEGAVRAASA